MSESIKYREYIHNLRNVNEMMILMMTKEFGVTDRTNKSWEVHPLVDVHSSFAYNLQLAETFDIILCPVSLYISNCFLLF